MNQFKDVFLGREKRDYVRATTSQKCVRAGGKHNDLENVGVHRAPPHVLRDAGQLLLRRLLQEGRDRLRVGVPDRRTWASPKDRLTVTIFKGEDGVPRDAEAHGFWLAHVPADRILELGAKDNFWAMGDTGPCGPCSEIHFYQGDNLPCAEVEAGRDVPRRRVRVRPLARDLEPRVHAVRPRRVGHAAIRCPRPASTPAWASSASPRWCRASSPTTTPTSSSRSSRRVGERAGKTYGDGRADDVSLRVIADHLRATTFLIARRRDARQRGPRLRAAQDHAARDAPREEARHRGRVPARARPRPWSSA